MNPTITALRIRRIAVDVEVDIYVDLQHGRRLAAYLGIDVGSTSTKAVLMDRAKAVLAGFYTRTAGKPVAAVQALLAAIHDMVLKNRSI